MFEELEQIPWSELVNSPRHPRRRPLVVALTVAGLAVVAFLWLRPSAERPTVAVPVVARAAPVAAQNTDVSAEVSVPLSEADLMAEATADELVALGAAIVELRGRSSPDHYVEWAVAEELTPLSEGLWSVRVAFQALVPSLADGLQRTPVRRVEIPVAVRDGLSTVAGPLAPSDYVPEVPVDAWELAAGTVPDVIDAVARRELGSWGAFEVVSGAHVDDLWRLMIHADGLEIGVWVTTEGVLFGLPVPNSGEGGF